MTSVAPLLVAFGVLWFLLGGWKTGSLFGTDAARLWSNRLSAVGIGLSVALVLVGLTLTWRRRVREAGRDGRLAAGIFLVGIPAFLTLVVMVLYSL